MGVLANTVLMGGSERSSKWYNQESARSLNCDLEFFASKYDAMVTSPDGVPERIGELLDIHLL